MSWIEKMVGGTVGYEGQGPIWVTLGKKLGIGPEADQDETLAPQKSTSTIRLGMVRWQGGGTLTGVLARPIPGPATAVITLQQRGQIIGAEAPFANEHGHFWMTVPVHDSAFAFHLPFAALKYDEDGPSASLQVALAAEGKRVVSELFAIALPTAPRPWDPVSLFEPLIRLCVGVAHADGQFSDDEGSRIRAYFEKELGLGLHSKATLRHLVVEGPPEDLQDAVDDLCLRFPAFRPGEVLEFLVGIAFADGEVDRREVRFLEDVARKLGVPEERWPDLAADLGLAAAH
jgi:uncharacterized tellurite resistance protein B-like protein